MANTRLFDSWQIQKELPAPFDMALANRPRYSTKEEDCSIHNRITRGKKATLFPVVLRALLNLIREGDGKHLAAGMQVQKGQTAFYCMEYHCKAANGEYDCAVVYNPKNGRIKERILCGSDGLENPSEDMHAAHTSPPFQITDSECTGEELIALLSYASIEKGGPLYDGEFSQHYKKLKDNHDSGWKDPEGMLHSAYICCDNLFCRVENGSSLRKAGIPFDRNRYEDGNVDVLSAKELRTGIYIPNHTAMGCFNIFYFQDREQEHEILDMQKIYGKEILLSEEEKLLVPKLPPSYKVGKYAAEILKAVDKTPARTFMMTGSAGVGKSTDAQIIAQVLGYPYYFFTCGPDTDELSLVASMVPNTRKDKERALSFPTCEDMLMDPASALKEMTGEYQCGISREEAFSEILSAVYEQGRQAAGKEKDFTMVESSIITGCKGPSVVEIQEPTVIERPAALVKLNSLLDDTAAITLLNGEVIYRHPETIIILTTNLNYAGCRNFNESVLSRVQFVQHRKDMTVEQMVQRASRRTGFTDMELLREMAEISLEIRRHIHEEEIQGGLCDYREYEGWIWSFVAKGNILDAAQDTIVGKASMDSEDREEIMEIYVRPHFEEAA